MPLFEFECIECNKTFEDLVRNNIDLKSVICPFCGSDSTRKKISTFASRVVGASISSNMSSGITASSCSSGST
ncbi:MAG: zinc ribbon domain-containing protein [Chloroflexota bacterium]